ncbi:hypothetical protein NKH77_43910 [Streptomyces sp. M19]
MFTGSMSQETQPWTRDHMVFGIVLVPGAAMVEMALTIGRRLGCDVVDELVVAAPLVLEDHVTRQIRITAGPAGEDGRREIAFFSRIETGEDEAAELTCHARGWLAAKAEPWRRCPPVAAGGRRVPGRVRAVHDAQPERPPHRCGLRLRPGLPRRTVRLAPGRRGPRRAGAARSGGIGRRVRDSPGDVRLGSARRARHARHGRGHPSGLPFSWTGVQLERFGLTRLRVRITLPDPTALRLDIAGEDGMPLACLRRLDVRPVEQAHLEAARRTANGTSTRWTGFRHRPWRHDRPGSPRSARSARSVARWSGSRTCPRWRRPWPTARARPTRSWPPSAPGRRRARRGPYRHRRGAGAGAELAGQRVAGRVPARPGDPARGLRRRRGSRCRPGRGVGSAAERPVRAPGTVRPGRPGRGRRTGLGRVARHGRAPTCRTWRQGARAEAEPDLRRLRRR